jgi:hypothetical protein
MSDYRRYGQIVGFWGTISSVTGLPVREAVLAGGHSRAVYLDTAIDIGLGVLLDVSAATTITVLAAHSSQLTSSGDEPDRSTPPADSLFYPVQWNATSSALTFAGAGTAYLLIPQFIPGWVKLSSSGAANIIGGYEAS